MLSPIQIQIYRCAGTKAGNARRMGNESLADGLQHWCKRAVALEQPMDRECCREAFDSAYLEAVNAELLPH
jgi:hypothetical protein